MTDIIPININLTTRDQLNLVSFWVNILKESLARVHVDMLGAASDRIQVQRNDHDHAVQLTYQRSVWRPRKRTPDVSIRDKNSYDQTYTIWADTSDDTWTIMRFNLVVDGETVEGYTFYHENHRAKQLDPDLQALYEAMLEKVNRSDKPTEPSVKPKSKQESKMKKKVKLTPEMTEEVQALYEYLCLSGLVGLADPLSVALDKGSCKLATIGRGERFTAIYHGMVKEKDESIKKKIRWTIELNAYLEDGQWDWSALFVNRITKTKETTLTAEDIEEGISDDDGSTQRPLVKPESHVSLDHASWHVEKHMAPAGIGLGHLLSAAVARHLAKKEAK